MEGNFFLGEKGKKEDIWRGTKYFFGEWKKTEKENIWGGEGKVGKYNGEGNFFAVGWALPIGQGHRRL